MLKIVVTLIISFIIINSLNCAYLSKRTKKTNSFKMVCYVTNWAQYRPNATKFTPQNVDPFLCTHVIYAFASINSTTHEINAFEWNDESKDNMTGRYEELNNLKLKNKQLKTLLSVGGWNLGSKAFSDMAINSTNRLKFIESAVKYLRKWKFDGLDVDWEFPAKREGSRAEDKNSLVLLVRELRDYFYVEAMNTNQEQLLLSLAVAAEKQTILNAYDIPLIVSHVDFLNIMAYDYYGSWDKKLGHNSPLKTRSNASGDDLRLNIDWTIRLFYTLGAPLEKLILGVPFYGRSFTLKNKNNTFLGAESKSAGLSGAYTREEGFLSFGFEICSNLKSKNWTRKWSYEHEVPYAFFDDQWVGYDDEESIKLKTEYIVKNCLGGALAWSIDLDDFNNFCYEKKYPLTNLISSILDKMDRNNCTKLDLVIDDDVQKLRVGHLMENDDVNWTNTETITESTIKSTTPSSTQTSTNIKINNLKQAINNSKENFYKDEPLFEKLQNVVETTKQEEEKCKNKNDGVLVVDPNDCSYFYVCLKQHMTSRTKCTTNLYFDEKLQVCNWPSQITSMLLCKI